LLKLLDTADILSVQVHPDDECAARLGEQDSGKTEMWYVLHGEPHSKLICGLQPDVTPEIFRAAVREQRLEDILRQVEVHQGTAVLIPSGSVHSIGPGLVLAEIQQSSDLTYRIYDWGRPTTDQNSRELHLEKALQTIHFGAEPPKPITPSTAPENRRRHSLLATCPFFTAELITLQGQGRAECSTLGESFHIVLAVSGRLAFATSNDKKQLCPAQALLIPASAQEFVAEGEGSFLDYYVGDTE
jgi:mannose-6-phosphate isomerase